MTAAPIIVTPIIVTLGDPAGIGTEITLKAAATPANSGFVVIGDPAHLSDEIKRLGLDLDIQEWHPNEATQAGRLCVYPISWPVLPKAGCPDTANAPAIIEAIETAVRLCKTDKAAAMVTNPIAKSVLYEAGFSHPGHTEFLAALDGHNKAPIMLLANESLRVVPLTIHQPLASVPRAITTELLLSRLPDIDKAMRLNFGLRKPRIAVCGLNPHAGEDGHIGTEERDVIQPAIAQLRSRGLDITGPFPADTLFTPKARQTYDVAIGMYHDQVLIPVKALDFHNSVNATLNLSFIRTSPDHGTAFDIAGTGTARPDSLIAALKMAHQMAEHKRANS